MPTIEQIDWIEDFMKASDTRIQWHKINDEKQRLLGEVRQHVALQKERIQDMCKFSLKKNGGDLMHSLVGDKQANWGADEEIDTVADTKKLKEALSVEMQNRVYRVNEELMGLSRKLEDAEIDGVSLFTEKEIREEFWKPLSREAVIPDNMIPGKFNETEVVFLGANAFYVERQKAVEEHNKVVGGINASKFFLEKAKTVASTVAELAGAPDVVGTAMDLTHTVMQATLTITTGVIEKDCDSVIDAVGDVLGESLDAAGVPSEISKVVTTSFSTAHSSGKALKCLAEGDIDGFWESTGEAIGSAFELGDTGSDSTTFADIGGYIQKGFEGASTIKESGQKLKEWYDRYKEDPDGTGIRDLLDVVVEISTTVISEMIEGATEEGTPVNEMLTEACDDLTDEEGVVEQLVTIAAGKQQEELAEELEEEFENSWEDDLDAMLDMANADPATMSEKERKSGERKIEKMIQKIERMRAGIKLAEAIFDTGMKTASQFFEPLQLATATKDMAKNIIIAVKRGIELNQWIDKVEDAMKGASVYGAAFANRVKNLRVQITHRTLQAALDLLKVAGGALSVAGAAGFGAGALAGTIVVKTATIAEAGMEATFKIEEMVDAKIQWHRYKKALEEPGNRKQMRKVLQGNPTLSKYAMAYGAIVEGDVIAKSGLRLAGIREDVIADVQDPDKGVEIVVKFMEVKFDEDPQLVKPPVHKDFAVADKAITLSNFNVSLENAREMHEFNFTGTGGIESLLAQYEVLHHEFQKARKAYLEFKPAFMTKRGQLLRLDRQLSGMHDELEKLAKSYRASRHEFHKLQKDADSHADDGRWIIEYAGQIKDCLPKARDRRSKIVYYRADCATFLDHAASISNGLATKYADAATQYEQAKAADSDYVKTMDRLIAELLAYKPTRTKKGLDDPEVAEFCRGFAARVNVQRGEVLGIDPGLGAEQDLIISVVDQFKRNSQRCQEISDQRSELRRSLEGTKRVIGSLDSEQAKWKDAFDAARRKADEATSEFAVPEFECSKSQWGKVKQGARKFNLVTKESTGLSDAIDDAKTAYYDGWKKDKTDEQKQEAATKSLQALVKVSYATAKHVEHKELRKYIRQFAGWGRERIKRIRDES